MQCQPGIERWIYNLLHGIAIPVELLYYAYRARHNWNAPLRYVWQRLFPDGTLPPSGAWFHAVSVGEVMTLPPLLKLWEQTFKQHSFVTTVTYTGFRSAHQLGLSNIRFAPVDLAPFIHRFHHRVRPSCLCILETEIWPEMIWASARRQIPVFIINARISDTAVRGYRRWRFFFQRVLKCITGVAAQSERHRERWIDLGLSPERVITAGNLKFDSVRDRLQNTVTPEWLKNWCGQDLLIVFGSWHREEIACLEEVCMQIKHIPDLRICIAPRHPHDTGVFLEMLKRHQLRVIRRSAHRFPRDRRVLLLDTIGELTGVYAMATVAVVGGSFYSGGAGHNPIEPAWFARPVITGLFHHSFRDILEAFLEDDAIYVVKPSELSDTVLSLIHDPSRREQIGHRAKAVVERQGGAAQRTIDWIRSLRVLTQ